MTTTTSSKVTCGCCGEPLVGWPRVARFQLPDVVFALGQDEAWDKYIISGAIVIPRPPRKGDHAFARALFRCPIPEQNHHFDVSLWLRVSPETMDQLADNWENPPPSFRFSGLVANDILGFGGAEVECWFPAVGDLPVVSASSNEIVARLLERGLATVDYHQMLVDQGWMPEADGTN